MTKDPGGKAEKGGLEWLSHAIASAMRVARGGRRTNRYYKGPKSDHFDGTVFFNPHGVPPKPITDLLKWQILSERAPWPQEWPSPFAPAIPDQRVEGDALRLTMVGHASMLIQIAGMNVLTDPVWAERCSPFSWAGPKRVNPHGIALDDLPPIDLVLLSHNHYDHLDMEALRRIHTRYGARIVTPLGNDAILKEEMPGLDVVAGDWGDVFDIGPLRVHIEPAHHWSARGMGDRRMALWGAFVIEGPAGRIYHIGDTGFHQGRNYKAAAEKHGGFRLAILPIGAFEPRWFMEAQHQDPDEAVQGMQLCWAEFAAGHHWATFHLTNEAIDEPRVRLEKALDREGIARERFRPMLPGEVWDIPPSSRSGT
jgi:L-ascorbate metabolism protein UlaG (beta-lactamase superfamily)